MPAAALPYEEPSVVVILVLSSFILLLNLVGHVLDRLLYCGLIGQIFIGVAWGNPGGFWLTTAAQGVFVQLGYLGLTLLVYEGGLSTSFSALKSNLVVSLCVALTGICAPIGLSFVLIPLANVTPLQAFTAGAALCSTSLGTIFSVLKANGLTSTRLSVVLTSAAMLDDVVGLVVVQVISNLGDSGSSIHPAAVLRPVGVSVAFVVALLLLKSVVGRARSLRNKTAAWPSIAFPIHALILLGFVVASSYAGTSNLFAAYLAGVGITWYDEEAGRGIENDPQNAIGQLSPIRDQTCELKGTLTVEGAVKITTMTSGVSVYKKYYEEPVTRILKPLFFASIGFSIPISQMFSGPVVWRGIVYTLLMMVGKLICGLWLVRSQQLPGGSWGDGLPQVKSLYPALTLGSAMMARGEIGFLIAGIAESRGIFQAAGQSPDRSSSLFLIVTWAIMLCTIAGPIAVGVLTRRGRRGGHQQEAIGGD